MNNAAVKAFFDAYSGRFNTALQGKEPDLEATRAAFASCFVEASPVGIVCGRNDEKFQKSISEGYAFYKSIGTRSMDIDALEITPLNDLHALAKVHWNATYDKKGEKLEIQFDVFYLLQEKEGQLKIFAYITGDEQAVMREHGLIE